MDDGFACMFVGVVVLFSKINDFTLLHTSFASFAVAIATVVYSSVCTKCACFFRCFLWSKHMYVALLLYVRRAYICMDVWICGHRHIAFAQILKVTTTCNSLHLIQRRWWRRTDGRAQRLTNDNHLLAHSTYIHLYVVCICLCEYGEHFNTAMS